MITNARPPLTFVLVVFAFSLPFWWIGAVAGQQLQPGLPVSALMAVCPRIAASILVHRERGVAGLIELLKRSLDYRRIESRVWYLPILLLMPLATTVTAGAMRVMGTPLPAPRIALVPGLLMFLAFFVSGLSEELGWSGYAIDPLQARWNALRAAILLGLVWAIWHIVPLTQAHRSPEWIAWWCLYPWPYEYSSSGCTTTRDGAYSPPRSFMRRQTSAE